MKQCRSNRLKSTDCCWDTVAEVWYNTCDRLTDWGYVPLTSTPSPPSSANRPRSILYCSRREAAGEKPLLLLLWAFTVSSLNVTLLPPAGVRPLAAMRILYTHSLYFHDILFYFYTFLCFISFWLSTAVIREFPWGRTYDVLSYNRIIMIISSIRFPLFWKPYILSCLRTPGLLNH